MVDVCGKGSQRWRVLVQGIVQGVGFRPFVYAQAHSRGLSGFVFNDNSGVTIEIEGEPEALDAFQRTLHEEAPPLARVDMVKVEQITPRHEEGFTIIRSKAGDERRALISPDSAVCNDCLRELFDPADRRYTYPFINCTNCGPRFTIVQDVPYDRARTTMRVFPLCPICQAEYENPLNRRFHAQPNACPACGPQAQLFLWNSERPAPTPMASIGAPRNGDGTQDPDRLPGARSLPSHSVTWSADARHRRGMGENGDARQRRVVDGDAGHCQDDPIEQAARHLAVGAILAVKGLGGYHLVCDALDVEAVQRLRRLKQREARPFALMTPDLATARHLCRVSEAEAALLMSRQRPIVLLARRAGCPVAPEVAPAYNTLGIMLPYTPLHHLLLRAFARAVAPGAPAVLVMTSGNLSDEPIAYRDEDAWSRLRPLADGMLTFNREIHTRCDDSLLRVTVGGTQVLRRARGFVPEPLILPVEAPVHLLACGGHLKNTVCLGKGRRAFLSQHIGDLENLETLTSFHEGIAHFQRLFDAVPEAIAYDLHPEYLASKYALSTEIPRKIGVQHHHAHIASVMAEHGLTEPVIGIAADGTGYGTDGAIWGCEVLRVDLRDFQRLAHLAYIPLPGGEQAVRQPWRVAAVYLQRAFGDAFLDLDLPFTRQLHRVKWRILAQMLARGLNCPPTSSLGRLFDAVAALLGLPAGPAHAPLYMGDQLYEGQAAIELEQIASSASGEAESYPFAIGDQVPAQLDVAPLIRALVEDIQRGVPAARIARRFHNSIAALLAEACTWARERTGLNMVALSGGVFQNQLLLEALFCRLEEQAFRVFINRRVPPNDGGLSLGQAAIAAARLQAFSSVDKPLSEATAECGL